MHLNEHPCPPTGELAEPRSNVNVGTVERIVSAALGSTMIVAGVARRSLGGTLLALLGTPLAWRGFTGRCSVYKSLGVHHRDAHVNSHPMNRQVHGEATITVNRPRQDVYRFWCEPSALVRALPQLQSLETVRRDRWQGVVRGPGGRAFPFEAQIVEDRENELLSWRTIGEPPIKHRGKVEFCDASEGGTTVHLTYWYQPPLGVVGDLIARMLGANCSDQTRRALQQMKQTLEAGEIASAGEVQHEAKHRDRTGMHAHRTPVEEDEDACNPTDRVEESSRESFPASDPPSYTPGHS